MRAYYRYIDQLSGYTVLPDDVLRSLIARAVQNKVLRYTADGAEEQQWYALEWSSFYNCCVFCWRDENAPIGIHTDPQSSLVCLVKKVPNNSMHSFTHRTIFRSYVHWSTRWKHFTVIPCGTLLIIVPSKSSKTWWSLSHV